ncbi:MAG: 4-vinyl reductase [Myxococcota bacterium]
MSAQPLTVPRTARTRAFNPLAALSYVRAIAGESGVEQVLARLPVEDRRAIGNGRARPGGMNPLTWIPFMLQVRLLRAIDAVYGDGDLVLLRRVGHFMAKNDVLQVFAPLFRRRDPSWIMVAATRMWRHYHDHGHWKIAREPNGFLGVMEGHPESDEAFCTTLGGWIGGALELSGVSKVEVAHPVCDARGEEHCAFRVTWQGPVETQVKLVAQDEVTPVRQRIIARGDKIKPL